MSTYCNDALTATIAAYAHRSGYICSCTGAEMFFPIFSDPRGSPAPGLQAKLQLLLQFLLLLLIAGARKLT